MILAFKKGLEYKGTAGGADPKSEENIFPLMNIPLDAEGESMELNDFQWWSYSEKFKSWLRDNPRSWQAESSKPGATRAERILEGAANFSNPILDYVGEQITNVVTGKSVSSFSSFINEADEEEDANKDVIRKFQKLTSAIQKLIDDGELKSDLKVEDFPEGKPQAVVVDFYDAGGTPVYTSRSALRITKKYDVGNLILADLDYTIPAGPVEDTEDLMDKTIEFAKDAGIALVGLGGTYLALTAIGGAFTTWQLAKTGYGIYKWARPAKFASRVASGGGMSALKSFASRFIAGRGPAALANAGRVTLPSGAFVEGGLAYSTRATGNVLLRGAAAQSVKAAATRAAATTAAVGARAAAGSAGAGVAAAEATNPIGWIMLAVQVAGSGINQLWNWYSDKQAPMYSEVSSFAYNSFSPKNIPIGKSIIVCWTSDGGASSAWDIFIDIVTMSKDDTRTTMELVKIGEKGGRSIFILLQVNSEMLQKVVSDNDLVLLSFDNSDKFEEDTFDNDDLEFNIIGINKIEDFTVGTSLVGYCDWTVLEREYGKAPDYPMYVPADAKENYLFNYSDAEGKRVNVEGALLSASQVEDMDLAEVFPMPGAGGLSAATVSESLKSQILGESKVISFSEFSSLNEADPSEETKTPTTTGETPAAGEAPAEDKPKEEVVKDPEAEWETEMQGLGEVVPMEANEWGQIPVLIYKVTKKEYVDPNDLNIPGDYDFFVVDESSISPTDGQPISVEVTSLDPVNTPRYGFQEYVEPEEEVEADDEEVVDIEDVEDGETISSDDISIKNRKNSTIIRDKDPRGGINPLEKFGSDELRRDLGISDWDNITYAKIRYDRSDNPSRIILKNNLARVGDRKRTVKQGDLGFDSALKFAQDLEAGIKYAG